MILGNTPTSATLFSVVAGLTLVFLIQHTLRWRAAETGHKVNFKFVLPVINAVLAVTLAIVAMTGMLEYSDLANLLGIVGGLAVMIIACTLIYTTHLSFYSWAAYGVIVGMQVITAMLALSAVAYSRRVFSSTSGFQLVTATGFVENTAYFIANLLSWVTLVAGIGALLFFGGRTLVRKFQDWRADRAARKTNP